MIRSATDYLAGTVLDCDVCVIGGGPAGIAIGHELAGSSKSVILLESGGWKETPESQDSLRGFVWPSESHEPLEENRRRQFGGSSVAWGGRCVPLNQVDFENRSWIPFSGWPIRAEDLRLYLGSATKLCEAGRPIYDAREAFPDRQHEMIVGFDGPDVISSALERWGPPTNFAKRYRMLLEKARNITVLLNATATRLQLDQASGKVSEVNVAVTDSHRFSIRAQHVVLACGGLENARLLLASNNVARSGIGNGSDKVGRFYMSHTGGIHAWASLHDSTRGFIYEFERDSSAYVRRRFWVTAEAQRREEIGNAIACFLGPYLDQPMQDNPLSSATYLAKFALNLRRNSGRGRMERVRQNREALLRHIKVVVGGGLTFAPQIADIVRQRYFSNRRLPILLPRRVDLNNRFELFYQTEHVPNPSSRIVLRSERDALGVPRIEARISFTDLDVRTVVQTHRLIKEQLRRTGTGELHYEDAALEEAVRAQLRKFNSAAHHIGTTRMSGKAIDGVVDRNCRVYGTENLFVAGCSVFPTSGHANPTLTLVALAVRLAEHLKVL